MLTKTAAHRPLEHRSRRGDSDEVRRKARTPSGWREPGQIASRVQRDTAGVHQLAADPGEKLLEDELAAAEQGVGVARLRNAYPVLGRVRQLVTFDERDALEVIG